MIDDLPEVGAVANEPDVVPTSAALRAAFGPAARIDAVTFRTGAIRVTVRLGERSALLWSDADTAAWGCSADGESHVAGSRDEAIRLLAARWAAPE